MKKIISLLLMALLLTACGSAESTNGSTTDDSTSKNKQIEDVEKDAGSKDEKEEVKKEEPKTNTIQLGEALEIPDFAEITVNSNAFGKVINPPSPGSFYTYYENKETDQIYLDTVISVKSLLTSGKSADEFVSVKIIYDNKYEYTSFSTIEEDGGSNFTYTNITSIQPLQTGTLHFLASVPTQVESDGKPLKAVITVNGENYEQIIR